MAKKEIQLRPTVRAFAEAMEKQLSKSGQDQETWKEGEENADELLLSVVETALRARGQEGSKVNRILVDAAGKLLILADMYGESLGDDSDVDEEGEEAEGEESEEAE